MTLSVVIVTLNEEANLGRTLESVAPLVRDLAGEIIVVDSGSTDRTVEIARSFGAKVFVEPWKGFAAQKNSAIEKAGGDWVLLLDADEAMETGLAEEISFVLTNADKETPAPTDADGTSRLAVAIAEGWAAYWIPRKNMFLGRWIRHGGYWPDRKIRLFRRGAGRVEDRAVHETVIVPGRVGRLRRPLVHHAYPTLSGYIEHMNRYSSLGAEMAGPRGFSFIDIFIRPRLTFFYNYFLRLGFLDGREGLLLHLYHSAYVSWKYAKAWERSRKTSTMKDTKVHEER